MCCVTGSGWYGGGLPRGASSREDGSERVAMLPTQNSCPVLGSEITHQCVNRTNPFVALCVVQSTFASLTEDVKAKLYVEM